MKHLFAAAAGVILQRSPVSSFISNEIAKASGVYSGRNTSSETVGFEPNKFVGWYNYAFKFIEQARGRFNETGLPICNTHNETLLSQTDLFGYLKVIFKRQAISLHFSDEQKMRAKQQDTRKTASEKLANPENLLMFSEKFCLPTCPQV